MVSVVVEEIRRDAVRNEPTIKANICNFRACRLGRCNSSRQLEISVGNDKYTLVILCRFGKWSHDMHWNKVEWSMFSEKVQFLSVAVLEAVSLATLVCACDVVDVVGHVGPEKLATYFVVHWCWPRYPAVGG